MAVAEFGLAVNHKRKGADGQMKEEAMFIDCKVFDKKAETFSQYMTKGRPVLDRGPPGTPPVADARGPETLQAWRDRRELPVRRSAATAPKAAAPARSAARRSSRPRRPRRDSAPSYDGPEPAGPGDDIPF